MMKHINWCKHNILFIATAFLLAFIPLYPKLPLFDIAQTWVYIRLEDVFIAFAIAALGITYLKKRNMPDTPLTVPILWYFGIGLISLVNALLFIFPNFPSQLFPHLALLHYFRRIEYIALFFLAFEAFRQKKQLGIIIAVMSATFAFVLLYGAGQKFFGFPAFLTMNEEFAKGIPLRLPSTARIPSTFGGHYDLAAYLVFMIPIMGSLVFGMKRWFLKLLFFLLAVGGLIVLLFTASRISFGVYLIAVSAMLFWQKKPIFIIPVIIISILILNVTSGASERFYKTFRVSNVIVDLSTGKPIGTLDKLEGMGAVLQQIEQPDEESLPQGSGFINIPTSANSSEQEQIKKVISYGSEDLKGATGDVATISGSFLIQKALVYDISITTRFQGQWPKAMKAFQRNIVLGSGFSALSVAADGDYHRMLGEIGLLGTVAFLGIFIYAFVYFFRVKQSLSPLSQAFVIGAFAGLTGLLVNAVLIDVFEASKVAQTLWITLGCVFAVIVKEQTTNIDYLKMLKRIFTHPIAYACYLIVFVFILWGGTLSLYFIGDDFTWLRWAAQSKVADIIQYFSVADGFFYRPIPKLWYFLLFSVVWLKPFTYHLMSLLLVSGTVLLIYRLLIRRHVHWVLSLLMAAFFTTLSIHHENIFWISGHSSLLSGLFLIAAITLIFERKTMHIKMKWLIDAGIALLTLLSMLSYDGMLVAPIIVAVVGMALGKRRWSFLSILFLIPAYLYIRNLSGAVSPSGDYGYKSTTFLVNSIGNSVTYLLSIFVGPKAIEWSQALRLSLKTYLLPVSIITAITAMGISVFLYKARRRVKHVSELFVWLFCFIISLSAYLGLGGVAERYVYTASIFIVIVMALGLSMVLKYKRYMIFALFMMVVIAIGIWNIREISRLETDWQKASNIVEQSLLKIKRETFPPKDVKTFFIINAPIRYGRAWVFPTGFTDALWHMFRQSPYRYIPVNTLEDAFSYSITVGDREVFIFEDFTLKRGIRQEKILEEK